MRQDEFPDAGVAGASARREGERRRARREQAVRERHRRLGGLLLSLQRAPGHERAWATGASGEEHVAAVLERHCGERVACLHDRRVPRSRANIDHIAVAPGGVWVIDAKRYAGREVRVAAPLIGRPRLLVGGSDKTRLAVALAGQVELVRAAVERLEPEIAVHGALCFVDARFPLVGRRTFDGLLVTSPKRLAKRVRRDGPLARERIAPLAHALAESFPPA